MTNLPPPPGPEASQPPSDGRPPPPPPEPVAGQPSPGINPPPPPPPPNNQSSTPLPPHPSGSTSSTDRLDNAAKLLTDDHSSGLFGKKKALAEENAALRDALAQLGVLERSQLQAELENLRREIALAQDERTQVLDAEFERLNGQIQSAQIELESVRSDLASTRSQLVAVRDEQMLQEIGIYEYSHPLDSSIAYKAEIARIKDRHKSMVRNKQAVDGSTTWTINGSAAQGRKMVTDFSKLMLRAYNNEADNAVRSMKPYKRQSSVDRLEKIRETISKLGKTMDIHVTGAYHRLRVEELNLTADYLEKVAEEKEAERAEKARLREEAKALRDFERETSRLRKEEAHYQSALEAMRANGDEAGIAEAEAKLAEIHDAIVGVESRAANTRAGYVYVISNLGAFGERMVKIGMTRRLEPLDRVRELGDASVPFRYDVHALIFSNDAVGLEADLHHRFHEHRVNMVNNRREFFYVTPTEVREALTEFHANLLSFEEHPEATEWRQSENVRKQVEPVG